jgi:hypothetical protein
MTHKRMMTLGAAASLLLAGAAGAAFAHPHPDGEGDGDGKKVERRIVIIGDGDHGKPGKHEVRRFELRRDGAGHHGKAGGPRVRRFEMHGDALAHCDGGEKIVDESSGDGDKKTKVVICTKGEPTAAHAERLEKALERINSHDELSAEQKARIATALRSAIDRARSAR